MLGLKTMMYSKNFAAAIKVNGKILREFGDTVYLPFGSEYEIRLKNINTTRVKATIEIDGENVTGGGLIINPSETVDLERFIRNGNLSEGNRFKFIERTSKIEDHRDIKLEDGLITIRYEFELSLPTYKPFIQNTPYTKSVPINYYGVDGRALYNGELVNSTLANSITNLTNTNATLSVNETGITVEGSKSNQKFNTTLWSGSIGGTNVLTIKMLGETEENKKVREPVTVKTKLECKTCGTVNPATSNFCSECGTSLQLI
jgi:hypothetical protein